MSGPALVVKLGGSLAADKRLGAWLRVIAASRGVLLVPGGGPFADTVRAQQAVIGYDERAAHEMAMMAMSQFGLALAARLPGLTPALSLAELARSQAHEGGAIALAWPMLRAEETLPASWDVTSDSIALWLARRFSAPLLIIKAAPIPPQAGLSAMVREGVLDRFFPTLAAGVCRPIHLAGAIDLPDGAALDPERLPGQPLLQTRLA